MQQALWDHPEAADLLVRNRYRERFKLTSNDMDIEPVEEVIANMEIWRLDGIKQKLDNKRMEQESGGNTSG